MSQAEAPLIPAEKDDLGKAQLKVTVFIFHGLALLLPYNATLSAVDYFSATFGDGLLFAAPIALMLPKFVFAVMAAFVWKPGNEVGAATGFLGLLLCCMIVPVLNSARLVLLAAAAMSLFNGLLNAAITGMASTDVAFLVAMQSGVGLAGLTSSSLRVATKLVWNLHFSTQLFFGFACIVELLAFLLIWYGPLRDEQRCKKNGSEASKLKNALEAAGILILPLVSCFLNAVLTFAAFPGLASQVKPRDLGLSLEDGWWSVLFFVIFNVFDLAGKVFSGFPIARLRGNRGALIILAGQLLRGVVICFMATTSVLPDAGLCALFAAFAFTNGWWTSACFVLPHDLLPLELQDQAAMLNTLALMSGLSLGGFVGQAAFYGSS